MTDEETKEIFLESFFSNPIAATTTAPPRLTPPTALVKGRIEIELNYASAPKACENFRCLCDGSRGNGKASGKPLHYKGKRFHRIVKNFVVQGGDIVKNDGSGGDSIYGGTFKDEKGGLGKRHDGVGVVGMANSGSPHTNRSQFYITLAPELSQCDGKHVVLGRVRNEEGLALLERINAVAASEGGEPFTEVIIADCGVVEG